MSNKSEAAWHPNSGPEVPHADLIARLNNSRPLARHQLIDLAQEAADALAALGDTENKAQ